MVGRGLWACRYLCTAAGCPASIAAGCKIQSGDDALAHAWEAEGSRMAGAGNMYAAGRLNETAGALQHPVRWWHTYGYDWSEVSGR